MAFFISLRGPACAGMAALTLAVSGCGALGGVNLISVEEEWEMGRQFEEEIARELPLSDDPVVQGYVTRIGEELVARSEMAELDWRFYVVEEPEEINAFNVPGGLVYVYSGLILEADSAAELIGVMGHEVAHGVARHGTERLSQQFGLAVLAELVLGQDPGMIQQIVAQIVGAGAIARFSQSQEFEADDMGVQLMTDAGYDPQGMVVLLERLLELQQRDPGTVERLFATHPGVGDRIERIESQIAELEGTGDLRFDDGEFHDIQDRLR
jgi:beta-barrel assembly-enhancing protease